MNAVSTQVEFVVKEETFDSLVSLDHAITIFIPSTFDVDKVDLALAKDVLDYVADNLAREYGGVTENAPAIGRWPSDAKGMVKEDVTPVTVYVSEFTTKIQSHIMSLARYVKSVMRQESIFLVIDGKGKLLF